jgi:myo-inositol catabolism protein IolC
LKTTVAKATEEEAVCYVVDALYFRMIGLRPARWSNEPHKTAKAWPTVC